MFNIVLYNFNKKINSLARPNITGSTYQCVVKDVSSILTPVIEIADTKGTNQIPLFNYAYISAFKRYYFIDDISYTVGTWTLSMHCDVLASFKNDIMNSRQYVIRSASDYDLSILDTMYLTKLASFNDEYAVSNYEGPQGSGPDYVRVKYRAGSTGTVPYFNQALTDGYFVVGIVGNNTAGVTYYSFNNTAFQEFINRAMTLVPSDMTDVSSGLANAIYNPIQYITSVRWFPDGPEVKVSDNPVTNIKVGGYTVGPLTHGGYAVQIGRISKYYIQINIPKHPDTSKAYLNLSPYTELNLYFQPFGCIPLDTSKLANASSITVEWLVDFCGGACTMNIYRSGQTIWTPSGLIYTSSVDYGVQLPISSLIMDWKAGLTVSALSWLKNTIPSTSPAESIANDPNAYSHYPEYIRNRLSQNNTSNTDVLDKAQDLTASALGQISTVGSVGTFLAYMQDTPFIMAWFKDLTEEDSARFGRPLYQNKRIDNLSGFCVCSNATVTFSEGNPMKDEQAVIINALNSGIYIE